MSKKNSLKWIVRGLSTVWAVLFAAGLAAMIFAVQNPTQGEELSGSALVFVLFQVLAALFAISAGLVAAGAESQSIRKIAQVPMAGTGLMALVAVSLGVISATFA